MKHFEFMHILPDDDPTLTYTRELIERPIRAALNDSPPRAVVELPVYHGRGTRPYQLSIELVDCAGPIFDYQDSPNGIIHLTRADGEKRTIHPRGMGWEEFAAVLADFMEPWHEQIRAALDQVAGSLADLRRAHEIEGAIRIQLAENLRVARELGGLSVPDLTRITGLPTRTIHSYLGR